MIVLDTNVISELMKPTEERARNVFDWLAKQPGDLVFTTTISVAEILAGVAIMPEGKRRAGKAEAAQQVLRLFRDRVLSFDMPATHYFAETVTIRRRNGRSIDPFDLLIGAIARANDMAIATRNTADFADCGVKVFDPWHD
jgi:predicted nucleic acid-binding protein